MAKNKRISLISLFENNKRDVFDAGFFGNTQSNAGAVYIYGPRLYAKQKRSSTVGELHGALQARNLSFGTLSCFLGIL